MKRILPIILSLLAAWSVSAQHCSVAVNTIPPSSNTTPGFSPPYTQLACRTQGQLVDDTIYFVPQTTIAYAGVTVIVDSVTIDSIENLPAGLCWASNKVGNTFAAGEHAVMEISGAQTGAPGQYRLRVIATVYTNLATLSNIDLGPYLNEYYYLRVACANGNCLPVDTVHGINSPFIAYTGSCTLSMSASISGGGSFCPSATLSTAYDSTYTYLWSNGATTSSITVTTSGSYSVTVYSITDSAVAPAVSVTNTCGSTSTPGFSPASPSCATAGQYYSDSVFFVNNNNPAGLWIDSLTVDSVNNLPAGLTWSTSKPGNIFLMGDSGWVYFHGTTGSAPGQYALDFVTAAIVSGSHMITNRLMAGCYLRVACTGGSCIAVNTTLGSTNPFIPYTSACTLGASASISASGALNFCQGGQVTLTAAFDSTYTYQWSTGATTPSITVTTAGSYSLTVYSLLDSATAGPEVVTTSYCPGPGLSPSPNQLPCILNNVPTNDTLTFYSYSSTGGIPIDSMRIDSIGNLPTGIIWSTSRPGNMFVGGDSGYVFVDGTTSSATPGQYKLRIIATIYAVGSAFAVDLESQGFRYYARVGCTASQCIPIDSAGGVLYSFIPDSSCGFIPTVTISPSSNSVLCSGSGITLSAGGTPGCTYLWSTGATTASINVFTAGTYSVTGTYGSATASASVNIAANPGGPTAAFTIQPDATPHVWDVINQCTGTGLTYTWYWGDSTSTTTTSPTPSHTYTVAGYYNLCVYVTDSFGCTASYCDSALYLFKNGSGAAIQIHVLQYPAGIAPLSETQQQISYYGGLVHFSEAVTVPSRIALYDMSGRETMVLDRFTGSSLALPGMADGVYILHLSNDQYSLSKKLVIVH